MPNARVERYNGEPTIMIDGVPYPPMTITVATWRRSFPEVEDYLGRLGKAGLRIFYVETSTGWNRPGDPEKGKPSGLEQTMSDIDVLLRAVPEAYVILRLNVSPPPPG